MIRTTTKLQNSGTSTYPPPLTYTPHKKNKGWIAARGWNQWLFSPDPPAISGVGFGVYGSTKAALFPRCREILQHPITIWIPPPGSGSGTTPTPDPLRPCLCSSFKEGWEKGEISRLRKFAELSIRTAQHILHLYKQDAHDIQNTYLYAYVNDSKNAYRYTSEKKQRIENVLNATLFATAWDANDDVSTSGHFQGASSPFSIVDPRNKCRISAASHLPVYYCIYIKKSPTIIKFTLPKFKMEPENDAFQVRNLLFQWLNFRFHAKHVKLQGGLHFRGFPPVSFWRFESTPRPQFTNPMATI